MKKLPKKPDEVTRLRRRCKLLGEAVREEARVSDERARQLSFMEKEYAKQKALLEASAREGASLAARLDESAAKLAQEAAATKKAKAEAAHLKLMGEHDKSQAKLFAEKRDQWRAFAIQLGLSIHAIGDVVSGPGIDSMPEAVAVRLLCEGAKRKPCPVEPVPVPWQSVLVGGAALAAYAWLGTAWGAVKGAAK